VTICSTTSSDAQWPAHISSETLRERVYAAVMHLPKMEGGSVYQL